MKTKKVDNFWNFWNIKRSRNVTVEQFFSAFLFMLLLVRKTGETSQITPKNISKTKYQLLNEKLLNDWLLKRQFIFGRVAF